MTRIRPPQEVRTQSGQHQPPGEPRAFVIGLGTPATLSEPEDRVHLVEPTRDRRRQLVRGARHRRVVGES